MNTRRLIFGIIIVVIGSLMLVNATGLVHISLDWLHDWTKYIIPILVIVVGANILSRANKQFNVEGPVDAPETLSADGRIRHQVMFSAGRYVMNGKDFNGAELNAMLGGLTLDLRGAKIADGCVIDVRTFMGGMELFVSPDVRVEVRSNCFLGGVGNHVTSAPNADAKTIILNANCFMGGVDIKG